MNTAFYHQVKDNRKLDVNLLITECSMICTRHRKAYNTREKQVEIPQSQVDNQILDRFLLVLPAVDSSGGHNELLKW